MPNLELWALVVDRRRVGPERQYRQWLTTAGYAPADIVDGDRCSLLFPPAT